MADYRSVNLTFQVNGWRRNKCAVCLRFIKNDPEGVLCRCGQQYIADPDVQGNYLVVT